MLDFDEMLFQVGEFGIYQKALFAFQAPFCIFVTFTLFGQLFMTLYPRTIWCNSHFNCTSTTMTPFQRENFSFSYTSRQFLNPCFINNIDASFVSQVVNFINRDGGNCSGHPCNYNHTTNFSQLTPAHNQQGYPPAARFGTVHSQLPLPESVYGNWGGGYKYANFAPNAALYNGGGGSRNRYEYDEPTTTTTATTSPDGRQYASKGSTTRKPSITFDDHWSEEGEDEDSGSTTTPYEEWTTRRQSQATVRTTTKKQPFDSGPPTSWSGPNPTTSRSTSSNSNVDQNKSPGSQEYQGKGNNGGSGFGDAPLNWASNNKSCPSPRINLTILNNQSRIFLPVLSFTDKEIKDARAFVGGRRPAYLPVEQCDVTWDRVRAGVPYDTIVTEGNWWCNAEAYTTAAQAVFFLGAIVGGFVIGFIADNYGRVPALVIANLFGAIGGALSVVSTKFWLFMLFRFITGMAFDNCFTMMYILVLEFCGPTYRTLVANLSIAVFYTIGTLILPGLAILIQDWRIYGLVISLPMLLGLFAIFLVPESARWLLSKGRTKEATDILRSFAKVNRREVNERVFVEFEKDAEKLYNEMQGEEEASFTAALKTPRLRRTFILLVLIWSMIALVYDGHSRNILNLANEQWNVFWMFGLASMTEFPADMLLIFTLDRFGRRWLSFGSLTLSGASSIIAAAIPAQMRTFGLVMAIISRFFVNVSFNIGLQYAAELLPTVIRAQGVNAIHIMGYVASIISPFVASIGRTNPALSLILLGGFAITGGCLSLLLAETLGEDLPNSLEEAEAFGINQSFWNCPICAKPKDEDEDATPVEPEPEVIRRNNLRSTMRGETYRSSILSNSSRGYSSGGSRKGRYVALDPKPGGSGGVGRPTETTRLKRFTH